MHRRKVTFACIDAKLGEQIQWLLYDCRIDSRARKDPIRYKAKENGIAARNTSEYVTVL